MRTIEELIKESRSGSAFLPSLFTPVSDEYRCVGRDALRMRESVGKDLSQNAAILAESLDYAARTTTRW